MPQPDQNQRPHRLPHHSTSTSASHYNHFPPPLVARSGRISAPSISSLLENTKTANTLPPLSERDRPISTSANFWMFNFWTTKVGPEGWAPEGWRPRRVEAPKVEAPKGGGPEGWRPRRVEAPKGGGPKGGGPEGVLATFRSETPPLLPGDFGTDPQPRSMTIDLP